MQSNVMATFGIFDFVIDSDINFPELPEKESRKDVIVIRQCEHEYSDHAPTFSTHEWQDATGNIFLVSARTEKGYSLQFPGLAEFLIDGSCTKINYRINNGVPLDSLRHLIIDQVIPRIVGHKGNLVLHAAACEISPGKAIAFLGDSGAGKSTLVSSFHQNGARLISDDCILVDVDEIGAKVIPNYFGVRLFDDSARNIYPDDPGNLPVAHYTTKKRLLLPEDADTRTLEDNCTSLSALFILPNPDKHSEHKKVAARRIAGAEKLMSLIEQTFYLHPGEMTAVQKQFRDTGRILDHGIPVYELEYPRRLAELDGVRNQILRLMGV